MTYYSIENTHTDPKSWLYVTPRCKNVKNVDFLQRDWTAPCLRKTGANLSFGLGLSSMNRFQSKFVEMSRNKHWTKINTKCPLQPKYALALRWESRSVKIKPSTQLITCTYEWTVEWRKHTGSYCLPKIIKHVVSRIILQHILEMSAFSTNVSV